MRWLVFCLGLTALAPMALAEREFSPIASQPWPVSTSLRSLALPSPAFEAEGVPMLVNLWASWCIPCREELPALNRLRQRMAPGELRMVALNYGDAPAQIDAFVERLPIDLDIWLDADTRVSRQLPMRGLPTTFLIDSQGQVRYRLEGVTDWGSDAMVEQLTALLADWADAS
ncbi:TlpA family protein disulfide reductase [bacterium]|nr:TlpA family protein disulfide reductase [bacterium]